MPLSNKALTAAWMLANGRTDKQAYLAAEVTEQTFYRWKKRSDFLGAVDFLKGQRETEIEEKAKDLVSVETSRADEEKILGFQREMVEKLGDLSIQLLKQVKEDGIEELGPRYIPQFIKAFGDAVTALQGTNDRLIGLEALIEDVEAVEAALQARDIPIGEGNGAT